MSAPPTPVITPQPIRQARSNGSSLGTTIAWWSATMAYSAKAPRNISWRRSPPSPRRRRLSPSNATALRPVREIGLAEDRQVAVAIEAMAAMRVPRQDDVVADLRRPCASGPTVLDDARRLVAEHDRHRVAQRAFDDFEVGVAEPGRLDPHQHVAGLERGRP